MSEEKTEDLLAETDALKIKPPEPEAEAPEEEVKKPVIPAPDPDGKMPVGLWTTDKSLVTTTVYIYKNLRDGDIFFFVPHPLDESRKKELISDNVFLEEIKIEAKFTNPNRKDWDRYRERASTLHEASGQVIFSKAGTRRLFIRYHLMELDIPNPETGEPLQIEREGGRITRKVEGLIETLHPTLVEMLVSQFEVKVGISF